MESAYSSFVCNPFILRTIVEMCLHAMINNWDGSGMSSAKEQMNMQALGINEKGNSFDDPSNSPLTGQSTHFIQKQTEALQICNRI